MTPRDEAPELLPVTQDDRELAALCAVTPEYREYILSGRGDASLYVQVLARHRTQSAAAAKAREEGLREAIERHLKWLNNLPIPTTGRTAQMIELRAALSASDGEASDA